MSERTLLAAIDTLAVGTLRERDGNWSFRYESSWLAHARAFPLSPHLPLSGGAIEDSATLRPVEWYFDNLLPEESQRELLARDARIDAADAFGLLAWYGAESAGSVTLRAPDAAPEPAGGLKPLGDAELMRRIDQMPRQALAHGAPKRMSLAGAQHKLAVVLEAGALFEPSGALASSHILKPAHPLGDYPHSVINEWFVMRLAQRLGLAVPEIQRRYLPAPIYLIARFDRRRTPSGWQRLHALDACQLLGIARLFKYSAGSVARLAQLAQACRSPAVARSRLFGWLVFNMLTGNSDAHLKNLSFMMSHEGVQLAPFYDLLCVAAYDTPAYDQSGWPQQTHLAWPLPGAQRFAELHRRVLIEAGANLGLAPSTAARQLESLRARISKEAEILYAEVEAEYSASDTQSDAALATARAGELRCLRVIVHTIIRDMVERLA